MDAFRPKRSGANCPFCILLAMACRRNKSANVGKGHWISRPNLDRRIAVAMGRLSGLIFCILTSWLPPQARGWLIAFVSRCLNDLAREPATLFISVPACAYRWCVPRPILLSLNASHRAGKSCQELRILEGLPLERFFSASGLRRAKCWALVK